MKVPLIRTQYIVRYYLLGSALIASFAHCHIRHAAPSEPVRPFTPLLCCRPSKPTGFGSNNFLMESNISAVSKVE